MVMRNSGIIYLNGEKILDLNLGDNTLLNSNEMYFFPLLRENR